MNKQAKTLFIPSSFKGARVALHDSLTANRHYQQFIQTAFARISDTQEGLRFLVNSFARIADHALAAKQTDAAEQIAQQMLDLPISNQSRGVIRYYEAECLRRRGDFDNARRVSELVVETATPVYRARVLQCIGATYYDSGRVDEAAPFYIEAGKTAAGCDPSRMVQSQKMLAVIRSINGDHRQALDLLEDLFPVVRVASKQNPAIYFDYLNSMAVELGEVGRIGEAHQALNIALASPFASAYPEWSETRDELEAKRTTATPSVVAVTRAPEAAKPEEAQPESKPRPAKSRGLLWLQITTGSPLKNLPAASAAGFHPSTAFGLDRLGHSIKPRAPPSRI